MQDPTGVRQHEARAHVQFEQIALVKGRAHDAIRSLRRSKPQDLQQFISL